MKYIAEIGLNHCGSKKIADIMLKKLILSKVNAITFQIKNDNFYQNLKKGFKYTKIFFENEIIREKNFYNHLFKKKYNNLKLKKNYYKKAIKIIKKNNKEIGFAIGEAKMIKILADYGADFFKILSDDFTNLELIKKAVKSKVKKVYISTGTSSIKEIKKLLKKIDKKKIELIFTKFNDKLTTNKLNGISKLKKITNLPVSFGNHNKNTKIMKQAIKYKPESIFFYVKINSKKPFPDDKHAIKLNDINRKIFK